ncbi:MAG TPA: AMP-binding protein [Terriglobales bacterium]|nr:AMP-binding protein [Terriglobales bacterium]
MNESTMMDFPLTLAAVLRRAETWFGQVEVVSGAGRSSWAEVARHARGVAAALAEAGVEAGDRVATLRWNNIEHLAAYFGVPLAGAVVHPLNLRLHADELIRIMNIAADRFVLVDDALLPLWEQLRPYVAARRLDLSIRTAQFQEPAIAENDGAGMAFTSGTTGEPKGVIYSHRAIALHALATALPDAMNLRERDCVFPLVPMFHANAWGVPYTAAMVGCKLVLGGACFDAESALDWLAGEQVTFSAGVGVIWQNIFDALDRNPGRWRLHPELRVNLGGAPASIGLFRRFDQHHVAVNMGWGMTEMTPVGTMNPNYSGDRRTRQGRPLPFVEARTAASGELEVRGPWVAGHYVAGADAGAWTADGWFRTGDVVEFDDQGLMEIVDRHKDLIRSGGEWISSVALENALATHPGVREAAVIAVPHEKWQERPLAVVVGAAPVTEEELRAWLASSFAAWQCPDRYVFADALPRTSTGKIDKKRLRSELHTLGTIVS